MITLNLKIEVEERFSILFYAKKAKATREGLIPIYLRVTIAGKRFEVNTQRHVLPDRWLTGAGRVKGNSAWSRETNAYLDNLLIKVYACQKELTQERVAVSADTFAQKWAGEKKEARRLLEIFEKHNDQLAQLIGNGYAPATLTKYKTTLSYTRDFIRWKYAEEDLDISALNYAFISEFEFWLKAHKKCAHNTTMKYLVNLKKVVLIAVKSGWLDKDPFSNYKMSRQTVNRQALTESELDAISAKDFENDRLNQVRDIFLFCCYTGLAYSDVERLGHKDIVDGYGGEKWLVINRQKTDSQSRVPLLSPAKQILSRYEHHPVCATKNRLLPVLSNQKMNSYLKEIGNVCRINKPITFHLARHTFATTVTLTNGVPIESVSKMLGHTSIKTTQIYAKIVDRKISEDMMPIKHKLERGFG